jgi:hypothetical protein
MQYQLFVENFFTSNLTGIDGIFDRRENVVNELVLESRTSWPQLWKFELLCSGLFGLSDLETKILELVVLYGDVMSGALLSWMDCPVILSDEVGDTEDVLLSVTG